MLDFSNHFKKITVTSPYHDETVGYVPDTPKSFVKTVMKKAEDGAKLCKSLSAHQMAEILEKTAHLIQKDKDLFAKTITLEAGKTITQAQKEVDRCINTISLSAIEAKKNHGEVINFQSYKGSENRQGYYKRCPLGIVLAITPFNDPLNLVAHKIGPALASQNAIILKPSIETPLSAFLLTQTLYQAGLDPSILQVLVGSDGITQELVKQRNIRAISFTGGNLTAEKITQAAGLKKMIMDLGGNAAVIVMQDCHLEKTVETCISGSFWAAGQNCIGTQRILIEESIYDEFKSLFIAKTKKLNYGDPIESSCDMGPMINEKSAKNIEDKVNYSIANGANLLTGNIRKGSLYAPTVLENVKPHCPIRSEEAFAPVVTLQKIANIEEAIQFANENEVSLQAGIFTNRLDYALKASNEIDAGGVMINDSSDYRFDAMPFGGFKYGSMGREGVSFAAEELSQTKVICFNQ